MSLPRHNHQTFDDVHSFVAYSYADATARDAATGFITEDLYKVAIQLDDGTFWVLTATTPTWAQLQVGPATSSDGSDRNPSYLVLSSTGSLASERVLSVSGTSGLLASDGGGNSTFALSINNNVVATISGSTFTGPVSASGGLSGSLQQVAPNLPYLVAGPEITITTQSNGQVYISGSLFGARFVQTSSFTSNVFHNTTTNLRSALPFTASNLDPGTYRLGWMYFWRSNIASTSFWAEIYIGSTSSFQHIEETSEVSPNERLIASGFTYLTITGSVQTFDIRGRVEAAATNVTSSIYDRAFELWKVS